MSALDTEVLIVGAGPVGATLAGLLGKQGVDCVIIDSKEAPGPIADVDPRALAITLASRQILGSFDLWDKLPQDRIGVFKRMLVWDENGNGRIEFDCEDLNRHCLGYIVEQGVLERCLNTLLEYIPVVSIQRGVALESLHWEYDAVCALLSNGQGLRARLVVAADGANSRARDLAGINFIKHNYHQQALACVVKTELAHDEIARQRFLSKGPLAFLPLADPYHCGIVWSTTPDHALLLRDIDCVGFHSMLQQAFDNTLGKITESQERVCFPLRRAQAEHYCRERFVLVGDAAHSIHPLAGQGANLGLLDVACLAQVLAKARGQNKDIGGKNILRKYERWRKGDNQTKAIAMEGFKYLFERQDKYLPFLRNTGMDLVNSTAVVKHWIMRRAMGLEGDLPDVARA